MGCTIGEVARRTGVPTSTLRCWERMELLPMPERVSGRRSYRPNVLEAIALVQLVQASALTEARATLDVLLACSCASLGDCSSQLKTAPA